MSLRALADPLEQSQRRTGPRREPSGANVRSERIAAVGLATVGVALGASQLVDGVYNESVWAPIALGALAMVVALTVAAPRPPPLRLIGPVLGLWVWSLLSAAWSDSTDAARVAANRWLLYAAAIAILWWAVAGDRRRGLVLVNGAAVGVLVVAVWMLARMLSGNGPALFLSTRLSDPLGYVNGQAGYLLAAAWPCLAWAEHRGSRSSPTIAGAGMAGLIVLLGLGLLCQSRSWEVALVVVIVVLEVAVPGRRRRAVALMLAAGTMTAMFTALAAVWRHPDPATGVVTATSTRHAAVVILVGALAAGLGWAAAVQCVHRLAPAGTPARTAIRRGAAAVFAALGLAAVAATAINARSINRTVSDQYHVFVRLSTSSGSDRLVTGAGNRYDYWRVAVTEFHAAPVAGVGAGNYDAGYYLHRRTTESITQPHSIELQTLAELGLVGALLLAVFLAAIAIGLHTSARAGRRDLLARGLAVAAGGTFTGWLVQTSVDWMHLIPGLTAIALAAAVGLTCGAKPRAAALGGRARVAALVAATALAVAGVVTIAPRILSLDAQTSAQNALGAGAPRAAIRDATTALEYDPSSVDALVLRAAGLARLDAFEPSLADLRRAVAIDPHNWVTWALVGDLLTRRGERAAARTAYLHALALDPLEPDLHAALGVQ